MLLLNVHCESFDVREAVNTEGTVMHNHLIDATKELYAPIATVLHAKGIAMSRIATVTLSSDCTTTGTVAASKYRHKDGRPKDDDNGAVALAADMTMRRTLGFAKRLRREHMALLRTQLRGTAK